VQAVPQLDLCAGVRLWSDLIIFSTIFCRKPSCGPFSVLLPVLLVLCGCGGRGCPATALRRPKRASLSRFFCDAQRHANVGELPVVLSESTGLTCTRFRAIDWHQAPPGAFLFAYIKAIRGRHVARSMFTLTARGRPQPGCGMGLIISITSAVRRRSRAAWFIATCRATPGALHGAGYGMEPPVRTCSASPMRTVRAEATGVFLDMLERHYGKRPLVYTTR